MSIFKKIFASVGIGGVSIDTILFQPNVYPGGILEGEIVIKGGGIEQEIGVISMNLEVEVTREINDSKVREWVNFFSFKVNHNVYSIKPKEIKTLPFKVNLPWELPVTSIAGNDLGKIKVHLRTVLDVDNAIDPTDRDYLKVESLPVMTKFIQAVSSLGFDFYKADMEAGRIPDSVMPFFQEIEFKAYRSAYSSKINELEVSFVAKANGLVVILEFDKRRGFFGGSQDVYRKMFIPYNDNNYDYIGELKAILARV